MSIPRRCLLAIILVSAVFSVGACNRKSDSYSQLCKIYEEYTNDSIPRDVAAVKITEHVERKLPQIYDAYVVVVLNNVDTRYRAFEELARAANEPNWRCDAIRTFYTTSSKAQ